MSLGATRTEAIKVEAGGIESQGPLETVERALEELGHANERVAAATKERDFWREKAKVAFDELSKTVGYIEQTLNERFLGEE